jgi:hypothetical protein
MSDQTAKGNPAAARVYNVINSFILLPNIAMLHAGTKAPHAAAIWQTIHFEGVGDERDQIRKSFEDLTNCILHFAFFFLPMC